jgi:predicted alpha-1,2-mannosidase
VSPSPRVASLAAACLLTFSACAVPGRPSPVIRPLEAVDPLIGTAASTTPSATRHSTADNEPRGQTFPAVGVPFGMTHLTPQTRTSAAKCVSPYYHQDRLTQGIRASHWMSGSCTQDYGSFTLMPIVGQLRVDPEDRDQPFYHQRETATPAYYQVQFESSGARVEATGTSRAGILRFELSDRAPGYLVVNPNSQQGRGRLEVLPDRGEIVGSNPVFRIYAGQGEAAGFSGHFVARLEHPISEHGTWKDGALEPAGAVVEAGDSAVIGVYARLDVPAGGIVRVKVGTSFTSVDEARRNLDAEIPGWDFDAVRAQAESAWRELLERVEVEGGSEEQRTMFYSALYHTLLLPRTFSDASGSYPGFAGSGAVQRASDFVYYDDFSLWDTFRAVHPLQALLAPERTSDMVRSLLEKAEQGGWLPIFPAWNSYTSAMIGDHATAMIADSYLKGIRGYDAERLYAFMRKNATEIPADSGLYRDGRGRRALESYLRYGYIPLEDSVPEAFHQGEQVSRTLEYAYDDFALAQMAGALGHEEDRQLFLQRAGNWRNVFDPETRLVRGRYADGTWITPFDATERAEFITEGSSWQYSWFVPHDVAGLIEAMGGREIFVARLDSLFDHSLYWHGNEPSHHIPYLYAYAGQPWKVQQRVAEILASEYDAGPGGLSGNDDSGQMSAWYAFSAMGFYPVAPSMPHYVLGSPIFERTTLHLAGGRTFTVVAEGVSDINRYVQAATLNGQPHDRPWIAHDELLQGGTLVLRMGPEPNPTWGSDPAAAPPSMSRLQ